MSKAKKKSNEKSKKPVSSAAAGKGSSKAAIKAPPKASSVAQSKTKLIKAAGKPAVGKDAKDAGHKPNLDATKKANKAGGEGMGSEKAQVKSLGKKATAAGKKTKKKSGEEFEEDVLPDVGDEVGAEELPDLSEFDMSEEEPVEVDDLLADDGEDEEEEKPADEEVYLTDAEGRRYCRVRDCDQIANVEAYCRYHYLLLWKRIQIRRGILADGKLERYVEELTSRYPDKFLEVIRKDLRNEKDFLNAIQELEIDENAGDNDFEDETQTFIDEVRGMSESSSSMSDEEEF